MTWAHQVVLFLCTGILYHSETNWLALPWSLTDEVILRFDNFTPKSKNTPPCDAQDTPHFIKS